METLYKNLGMIIGFLSGAFLLQVFFGEKFTEKSILLILFTMIMVNSKEFKKFLNKINDKLSEEQKRNKVTNKPKKSVRSKPAKTPIHADGGVGGGGSSSW